MEVPARTLRLIQPAHESTVVALPGYGSPYEPGTALDPAALAARLLQHPETRRASRAILLGHSASCQIVAEAAVQDPARVAGLILVGPTTDPRAASWSALAARWLRTAAWERPFQVPVLVRDYRHTGLTTMGRAMDAARRHRIGHLLRQVSCPVIVVRGGFRWRSRLAEGDRAAADRAWTATGFPGTVTALTRGETHHPMASRAGELAYSTGASSRRR